MMVNLEVQILYLMLLFHYWAILTQSILVHFSLNDILNIVCINKKMFLNFMLSIHFTNIFW